MEFLRLGDTSHDFLQVLIPEFVLSRKEKGVQLDINLTDSLLTLKKSSEKLIVNEKYENKKDKAEFLTLDNIIPSPHRRGLIFTPKDGQQVKS